MNELVHLGQIATINFVSMGMLRLGERALNAWLCVVAILMNLFVSKQVMLYGLEVCATDSLAVAYMMGLCLIQENFGKSSARWHVVFSFGCSVGFLLISWWHLKYLPGPNDEMHALFAQLLCLMPRLILASLTSFVLIQVVDIMFFQWLRQRLKGRFFGSRAGICMLLSLFLDSVIFTYLGLYGLVSSVWSVILFSTVTKSLASIACVPFCTLSRILCPCTESQSPSTTTQRTKWTLSWHRK